jgi:hypothetical protein
MRFEFLSDAWFDKVDELITAAGDLQIPPAMKAVEVNITVTAPGRATQLYLKDGLFYRGHVPTAPTRLTLDEALARKIFIDADAAAGVQAFLAGEMQAEGDLAKLVAMQTVEPSAAQQQLTQRIAAITI